jgi:LPXTG-motif cell wall-anchored protein
VKSVRTLVVASVVLASVGLAGTALAQSAEQPPRDDVRGKIIRGDQPEEQPGVLPSLQPRAEQPAVAPGVLPVTGADLVAFVVAGFIVIGVGAALVRRTRTTRAGT